MSPSAKTSEPARVPRRATYRLQLHAGFGFDAAAGIADYLAALGISHLYTSPYLQAAPGSTHGYDVIDHARVNEELGGAAAHARMLEALRRHGIRHIVDVVPNHMAIGGRGNAWWWDVLENGPASPYARYFDIEWYPPEERLRNVLLLPVLGDHYGRVLEAGEIRLVQEDGGLTVRYHDHVFPVAKGSVDGPLTPQTLAEINASPDRLDGILDRQHYRLAWWQAAARDLTYRRFFDVNSLVGLCAETETVFNDTHRLVLELARKGDIDGLRIDHPDGLRDPEAYLRRLRGACAPCYIVVEKILAADETLPDKWPVEGTTGYEFLNLVNGLFVDPAAEGPLTEFYGAFTGEPVDFPAVARQKKLQALDQSLGSDVSRLTDLLLGICERHRRHRDYTRHHLGDALRELLAAFPVYRTYVRPGACQVSDADRAHLDEALRRARAARPDLDGHLLEFVKQIMTLVVTGRDEGEFVQRFQQLSAPAMAKGVEDTAFYTYARFLALNEVGGDPGQFGVSVERFHAAMAERQARWPLAMSTTDTHDTKRGEDVRARLGVLSQVPARWTEAVRAWSAMNEGKRAGGFPDRNMEYFLYQVLVGAWPISEERLLPYVEKAAREAKVHTSWTAPDAAYESALKAFVQALLTDPQFVVALEDFTRPLIAAGRDVSLAQLLLKLTAPGVPDIYQGTELWAHTLVDPDNRRPVDFDVRRARLRDLDGAKLDEIAGRGDDALPKLRVLRRGLMLRAQYPECFDDRGSYEPVAAEGEQADRVVAFTRGGSVLTLVPRLMFGRAWGDTRLVLPPGGWCNALAGDVHKGRVPLGRLLDRFPVALLVRED